MLPSLPWFAPLTELTAAIHQPNFFPWLGYFDKIARSDVFIILDDAQYQKTGSSWSNRVKLLVAGEERWLTAPVRRPPHGVASINELQWADGLWREKVLRTIVMNYRACQFFAPTMAVIEPLVMNDDASVAGYNMTAIKALCSQLGLSTNLILASSFSLGSQSNERLIELCRKVGATSYLAGGGAAGYQDDALFQSAGIAVRYQSFQHPVYPQKGSQSFVAGLSIVDALMNCGVQGTRQLLAQRP